jgi:gamma-glutamylcyclotransferase (GGCT)/AIG2-like uncharacterized protein YtfP
MLYFAYGSNLHLAAMARRCPGAVALGSIKLGDSRLVFRGVADCIYEPGGECPGGVWKITPECEAALDRYEGVSAGFYRKEYVPVEGYADEDRMLVYVMNSTGIMPPSEGYYATIREGYRDFGLPARYLREALQTSWDDKHPSYRERQRHRRKGRPPLMRAPEPSVIVPRKRVAP